MPSYDFHCKKCGITFTKKLSLSERKNAACDNCGSTELEQQFKRCNVLGGSGQSQTSSCSRTGGCSGCAGC